MNRIKLMRPGKNRRGLAAIEFAICLPVLALLVFGSLEATAFIFLKQSLHVAAYEGVRNGSRADATQQLLAELHAALKLFTQTLSATPVDEHVGMASYEATATIDALLTSDLSKIDAATVRLRAAGFTSISRGMEAGQQIFQSGRSAQFVERTMVVMTDGLHNRGREPRTVATSLAAENILIHTITFGPNADIPRMQEVAAIGQGRHFHAADGAQLAQIYREIALSLSTLLTE